MYLSYIFFRKLLDYMFQQNKGVSQVRGRYGVQEQGLQRRTKEKDIIGMTKKGDPRSWQLWIRPGEVKKCRVLELSHWAGESGDVEWSFWGIIHLYSLIPWIYNLWYSPFAPGYISFYIHGHFVLLCFTSLCFVDIMFVCCCCCCFL